MAQLIVAAAGAAVGAAIAGPAGLALGANWTFLGLSAGAWGWTLGSLIGSRLFAPGGQDGPRVTDGKFSSTIFGEVVPLNYGTNRHGAHVLWWSGLRERAEEVGGKGFSDGTNIYYYSCDLLLSVCAGPQAAVLRIWANGRLIWKNNGTDDGVVDEQLVARGGVRVYLGTEDQMPDPTYEAAVGTENAVPYRGEVVVAIDNLQLQDFGNRVPSIEVEVASGVDEAPNCPVTAMAATDVQQAGLYVSDDIAGPKRFSAAYDDASKLYYVVTVGSGQTTKQLEAYDVSGTAPVFVQSWSLAAWNNSNIRVGGLTFDPENRWVRIAGSYIGGDPGIAAPAEYRLAGGTLIGSDSTLQVADWGFVWGDFPAYYSSRANNGARYGAMIAVYPDSGSTPGEVGWWVNGSVISGYRLARLANGYGNISHPPTTLPERPAPSYTTGFAFHDADSQGRQNYTSDLFYVPKGDWYGGGGYNIAWSYGSWAGYLDDNATVTSITGTGGGSGAHVHLVLAPSRKKMYALARASLSTIDLDPVTGSNGAVVGGRVSLASDTYTGMSRDGGVRFAVWNNRADGMVVGATGVDGMTMVLWDPDTQTTIASACNYPSTTSDIRAPYDIGDGRFVCIYGTTQVAIVTAPDGNAMTGQPVTLQSIVESLCDISGLAAGNLDATQGDDLVAGYKVARQTSARAAIEQLRPPYAFDMPEVGDKLVLHKRGQDAVEYITADDMGAMVGERTETTPAYEIEYVNDIEAPRSLEIRYVDYSADYDPGVQRIERQTGSSAAVQTVDIPVVLTASEARTIALRAMLEAHAARHSIKFSVSHEFDWLTPGDAVDVELAAGVYRRVRIVEVERARPMLTITGVLEEQGIYS